MKNMKDIGFELYYNNEKICEIDYVYLEDDTSLYLYNLLLENIIDIQEGERINFIGYITNKNKEKVFIIEYELILTKFLKCSKDANCLVLECKIDFSDANYDYDQDLVDLFYFWNKSKIYDSFRKNQWIYTFATLLYSGVPQTLPNNKTLTIKGKEIESKYGFFNTFGELFIGKRGYIGSGLDSLIDTFREAKLKNIVHENIINITDYELLVEKMNFYGENYLDEIICIFKEYGFTVNKI